jgi:hypothetical protein
MRREAYLKKRERFMLEIGRLHPVDFETEIKRSILRPTTPTSCTLPHRSFRIRVGRAIPPIITIRTSPTTSF